MTLASAQDNFAASEAQYSTGTRTGVRTAANFTITLGFTPKKIKVVNLTDRIEATLFVDAALGTSNVEGLLSVAAGTMTYADIGVTVGADDKSFDVVVATVGLETDDDDVVWEAWG
jgi:hypothetical protein